MSYSTSQWLTILLFTALLLVWSFAITNTNEHSWALNPWLPTTIIALLWSVCLDTSNRGPPR